MLGALDGSALGTRDGSRLAIVVGNTLGAMEGIAVGLAVAADGKKVGGTDALTEGTGLGLADGGVVSATEGATLRILVGPKEGLAEFPSLSTSCSAVGTCDGALEGAVDGFGTGAIVGLAVGCLVGLVDGLREGLDEGCDDGIADGFVGAKVGPAVVPPPPKLCEGVAVGLEAIEGAVAVVHDPASGALPFGEAVLRVEVVPDFVREDSKGLLELVERHGSVDAIACADHAEVP
eukprot:scaffold60_cov324-Pinguiococcus_pyrenoidosus.AAC.1